MGLHFCCCSSSHIQLFVTSWTAAHQASLSLTISQSFLRLMSIESRMQSNDLIACFSCCPQSFPVLASFLVSRLFTSGAQNIGTSTSASVLPMNIQGWFPLGLTAFIICFPRDSQESSPTPQIRSINCSALSLLYGPTLWLYRPYQQSNISAFSYNV